MKPLHASAFVLAASLAGCVVHDGGSPGSAPARNAFAQPARPVDVSAMRALAGRVRCAPREVAPGVWVHNDCTPHRPVFRAIAFVRPVRMGLAGDALPAYVDHRQSGIEGPVKNQGEVGACTAFSLSTAMDNAVRRMGKSDVVAPLHVWSKYAVPVMGVAGDEALDETVTVEQVWPYDPAKACKLLRDPFDSCGQAYKVQPGSGVVDPSLRAEQKNADAQGRYRITAVERLSTPANVDEMASVLAAGDDLWASFSIDGDAWKNRSLQGDVIPDYPSVEDEGHAVVLAGYRTVNGTKQFLVHNSWSEKWGDHGYAWLSQAMVQRWLRVAYRVRVADASQPAPPPPPQGVPGCAAGQVRDAVTGACASACPSGSPPAAGVCLPTIPGFPFPGPGPVQPPAPQGQCPAGQAIDLMTQRCSPVCPGGFPSVGGMCLPALH